MNRTASPRSMPSSVASPALISKLYAAGCRDVYVGRSDKGVCGLGTGTFGVMSTTMQSWDTHTKSRGNRISFIQKADAWPPSKTNSIPDWGLRLWRPESPLLRSDGVLATSAANTTPPMETAGAAGTGVRVGRVDAAVGVRVMVGLRPGVAAGAGVLDRVGAAVVVGVRVMVGLRPGVGAGAGVLDQVGEAIVRGVGVMVGLRPGVGAGVGVPDGVGAATGVGVPDGVGRASCCRTAFRASAAGDVGVSANDASAAGGVGVSANDASVAGGVGVFGSPHAKAASSAAAIREQSVRVMLDLPR